MIGVYVYDDQLQPGGRRPRLYLVRGGEVRKFVGEPIPGFCAIVARSPYRLELWPGIRPLYFLSPWEDSLGSWGQAAHELGLPIEVVKEVISKEYPLTAKRLDRVEAEAGAAEVVVVAFGAPTRYEMAAGWWTAPKSALTSDGRTVTVAPADGDWSDPRVLELEGAWVVSARYTPGVHGGYWAVEVAVPLAG